MNVDPIFLTSTMLNRAGITHGWFTRYGGVSDGQFDSLNGKKGNGDKDENVNENRMRAVTSLFAEQSLDSPRNEKIYTANHQLTHIIHEFKNNILEAHREGEFAGYDASITTSKNIVLSQTTADCGTVIISDIAGTVVSLVHGSWHTLSAKIICDVVAKMKIHTFNELVAGIGPMICKDCYEFGSEAEDLFDSKYLKPISRANDGVVERKYSVDLKQMIIDQLTESGISQIDDVNVCTLEDERFFSHRRSGARSGRFLTLAKLM